MLIEAFELRLTAAQRYTAALEFILPLVDGDVECLRDARRWQIWCERFLNTVKENMREGRVEDMVETFRVFGTPPGNMG